MHNNNVLVLYINWLQYCALIMINNQLFFNLYMSMDCNTRAVMHN